ncbi:MAG: DUF2029 domain-containing protein [Cyanobacteria bacterium SZAS TMP-1]|nr:DUF2029 domain-containing protein [Cyanobacteria bacterium SZAS TMP-1]
MKLSASRCLDGINLIYISLAAILFLTLAGSAFVGHTFTEQRKTARLFYCDFAKYYVCGKIAASPDRLKAYDAKVQADYLVKDALGDPSAPEEFIHYPPMDFPLMAPLATLPIEQCFLVFCLSGSLIFLTGTFFLSRAAAGAGAGFNSINALLFFWLAVFGSVPMLRAFALGQTSLFLAGITAVYIFAWMRKRSFLAGLALALTSIKPQYSVFLVVPALACRRYKLVLWAALCELVMVLAAVATIGPQNVINYPQIVLHAEQTANLAGGFVSEMVNVRGLLAIFMADSVAVKIAGGLSLIAWFYLASLWWKFGGLQKGEPTRARAHTVALLLATTVLYCLTFSPHTHLYDLVILSVVAPAATQSSIKSAWAGEEPRAEKLFSLLLLVYPAAGWLFLLMPGGIGACRTAPFALYNLALCALATISLYQQAPAAITDGTTPGSNQEPRMWI